MTTSHTPDINKILALPCNSGANQYGAQMGRTNQKEGAPECLYLQKVRIDRGGYDTGGAYWGFRRPGQSLFCAFSGDDTENDVPIRVFVDADGRAEAKAKVLERLFGEGWTFAR